MCPKHNHTSATLAAAIKITSAKAQLQSQIRNLALHLLRQMMIYQRCFLAHGQEQHMTRTIHIPPMKH
jgi:hypothetical protein